MRLGKLGIILGFIEDVLGPKKEICNHDRFVKSYKHTRDIGMVPFRYRCDKCGKDLKPIGWDEV